VLVEDLHGGPGRGYGVRTVSRSPVWSSRTLSAHHETYACWTMIIAMTCRLACTPGRTGTAAESQDLKSIRWAK
jgi:hypothetical protein